MTLAKLAAHAAPAGAYGGLMVALLVAIANPGAAGRTAPFLLGLVPVLVVYAAAAAVLWPLLYAGLRFFARHPLRLPWFSLRYTLGFHVANAAALLAAGWSMLSRHRGALGPVGARRLGTVCALLTLAWIVCAAVSVTPWLRRRAWAQRGAAAAALAALVAGAVAAAAGAPPAGAGADGARPARPAGAFAAARADPSRRLILLNFDGADLDTVLSLQAHGRLPAFSRLMDEGAYGRLRSLRPCVAAVTRATLVTGRLPHRHGVRGDRAWRIFGRDPAFEVIPPGIGFDRLLWPCLESTPLDVGSRAGLALWEIAARAGGDGAAAGWEIDPDRTPAPAGPPAEGAAPPGLAEILEPEAIASVDEAGALLVGAIAAALAEDARVLEALERLIDRGRPGVVAASFPGLDRVAHLALRYARPGVFGDVTGREVELYGEVLERYYGRVDAIVGRALQRAGAGAVVLVTSSHGMEPLPPMRRLAAALFGPGWPSGTHRDAPAGFLFARGAHIEAGRHFGKGWLADVVPTALYALDLPLPRDLDGTILAGVFTAPYTFAHPVTVLGTSGP